MLVQEIPHQCLLSKPNKLIHLPGWSGMNHHLDLSPVPYLGKQMLFPPGEVRAMLVSGLSMTGYRSFPVGRQAPEWRPVSHSTGSNVERLSACCSAWHVTWSPLLNLYLSPARCHADHPHMTNRESRPLVTGRART